MSFVLDGTQRSPMAEIRRPPKEPGKKEPDDVTAVKERLKSWQAFRISPQGRDCLKIAPAKMEQAQIEMQMPIEVAAFRTGPQGQIVMIDPQVITESRAEARGRYMVWNEILNEMEALAAYVTRIEKEQAARTAAQESSRRVIGRKTRIITPGGP